MILLKKQPSVDWEEPQVLCAGHQETSGRRWLQEHIWHIHTVWSIQIKENVQSLASLYPQKFLSTLFYHPPLSNTKGLYRSVELNGTWHIFKYFLWGWNLSIITERLNNRTSKPFNILFACLNFQMSKYYVKVTLMRESIRADFGGNSLSPWECVCILILPPCWKLFRRIKKGNAVPDVMCTDAGLV